MSIITATFAHGRATVEETSKERKPRQSKADRPFSPPGLGLVSSDYVKTALETHYLRLNSDPEYRDRYEQFRLEQWTKNINNEVRLRAWYAKKTEPAPIRVRGSEIKTCARQVFFRLSEAPAQAVGQNSPHWKLAALSGDQMHEELEIALKFLGAVEKSEYVVRSEDGTFSGRVDIRLKTTPAILDIKTVKPEDFKEGAWAEKVPSYIAQVTGYAHIEHCTTGIVLMVDRGSGKMLEFAWEVTPEAGIEVLARAAKIVEAVCNKAVPVAEYRVANKFDFRCRYFCPFEALCLKQEFDGSVQAALDKGKNLAEEFGPL